MSEPERGARRMIVVGVTGGIAAYKAALVIRALVTRGHEVHVVPTAAALRFIGRPTLEALSRHPVTDDLFDDVAQVRHVALGQRADAIVVAPATASSLAKLAAGIADDLLGTTLLAARGPVVVAPAMHTEMWEHAATRANIATLRARGVTVVPPAEGPLTGGDSGAGRLAEIDDIVRATLAAAEPAAPVGSAPDDASASPTDAAVQDLAGRRVLVTAGGTREPIDPVRFLGNRSSGRQGSAIAARAAARGASVTLVAANLEQPAPDGIRVVAAPSARDVETACRDLAPEHDVIIMAAAIADYRPLEVRDGKLAKEDVGERLRLDLVQNPDILRGLVERRRPGQVIVGFAAETEPDDAALAERARRKLARKGCDLLVVNRVGWEAGFGAPTNEVEVLRAGGELVASASGSKMSVADAILDAVERFGASAR